VGEAGTVATTARTERDDEPTRAWTVARILLLMGVGLLGLSALSAFRPVSNPGVQECGGSVPFLVFSGENRLIHLGDTGDPNEAQHSNQPTCRERALDEVGRAGRLFVAFLLVTAAGAVVGLVDDHLALRRAPRFETLLRELPLEDRARRGLVARVTPGELALRLPPVEGPELAGIIGWGLVALVALPLAGPWDATAAAVSGLRPVPLVLAALVMAATWSVAAGLRHRLLGGPGGPGGADTVLEAVAGSWDASLRPVTGAAGLDLFRLRARGVDAARALAAVQILVTLALVVHLLLLAPVALIVAHDPHPPTIVKEPQLILIAVMVTVVALGLCRLATRWRGLPVRPTGRAFAAFDEVAPEVGARAGAVGLTLAQPVLRAVLLGLVLAAYGVDTVPTDVIVLVALLGPVAMAVAPTPGGSGVVEAVTMLLLMLVAGVDPGRAAAVALTTRILMFWLPLAPGLVAARRLGRAGVSSSSKSAT
jgi:uncharacterized membrane protein YbhN (UPF0104 family)